MEIEKPKVKIRNFEFAITEDKDIALILAIQDLTNKLEHLRLSSII